MWGYQQPKLDTSTINTVIYYGYTAYGQSKGRNISACWTKTQRTRNVEPFKMLFNFFSSSSSPSFVPSLSFSEHEGPTVGSQEAARLSIRPAIAKYWSISLVYASGYREPPTFSATAKITNHTSRPGTCMHHLSNTYLFIKSYNASSSLQNPPAPPLLQSWSSHPSPNTNYILVPKCTSTARLFNINQSILNHPSHLILHSS